MTLVCPLPQEIIGYWPSLTVLQRLAGRCTPRSTVPRNGERSEPFLAIQHANLVPTDGDGNQNGRLVEFDGNAATFFRSGALRAPLAQKRG